MERESEELILSLFFVCVLGRRHGGNMKGTINEEESCSSGAKSWCGGWWCVVSWLRRTRKAGAEQGDAGQNWMGRKKKVPELGSSIRRTGSWGEPCTGVEKWVARRLEWLLL